MIRSEPFPQRSTPPPLFLPSDVTEDKRPSVNDSSDLNDAVTKQSVDNDNNNDTKKTEVKTEDVVDDPFGALDWKDGIATLPGTVMCRHKSIPV